MLSPCRWHAACGRRTVDSCADRPLWSRYLPRTVLPPWRLNATMACACTAELMSRYCPSFRAWPPLSHGCFLLPAAPSMMVCGSLRACASSPCCFCASAAQPHRPTRPPAPQAPYVGKFLEPRMSVESMLLAQVSKKLKFGGCWQLAGLGSLGPSGGCRGAVCTTTHLIRAPCGGWVAQGTQGRSFCSLPTDRR